jgi:ankyrin repeat protein
VIELNDSLGVFRFYHSYVFDFFRNHEPLVNNGLIAQLCLAHLSSTDFSRGPFPNAHWYDYKNIGPVKKHPFLEFASCNWFVSAKKSVEMDTKTGPKLQGVELLDNFRKLFQPEEDAKNLQLSFQIHRLTIKKSIPDTISHEHIISYFALHEFFDLFRKQGWLDLKRRDSEGLTAMHWAICNEGKGENENEAVQTIEKLIHFGGKISAKDNEGCTPLYYAAHYGNQSVLQLLLQKRHRAKLNARNNENETALIAACKKHHEKIVEELLEAGANVRIVSSVGTALHMVSMIGCNNCVEKVLKKYGRRRIVESESPFGTALHVAAFHGHINVVRLLCDRGLNIHATHEHYGSVLTAAATGGHRSMNPAPFREIFLELIKRGVDVNDKNGLCGPALRAAAYYGHIQLVEILLNNHATISAEGPMGTAYEAADSEGYQDIKELLLKWDPQAASYGDRNLNNAMNYQKLQQFLFKGALKASNMYLLNSLVEQVETYFEKRLEKGQTALFVNMLDLGKLIFTEVIDLSISSDKKMLKRQEKGAEPKNATYKDRETKSGEEEVPIKSSETTVLEWLRNSLEFFFSSQIRIKSDHKKYGFRVQSSFGRDGVDGRFPQVLDRLTQAAVRILEHAIFNGRPEVIKLIAETWIDTLNTLVERDESGELLKSVVESRVAELQKHLSNSKLTPDRRFKKAEGLACVGIELLFTAARQEEKYKQLAFILSKMWASALESVEDFGEEGQGPIRKLIQVFIQKFTATIQNNDRTNVEIWQRVGIEILRGTALQPRRRAMAKVSGELTKQLSTINEMKMEDLVKDVLESKLREYKDCLEKRKYEEALGLVLAVLELIRVAIEQGDTPVLVGLLPYLNKGVSWTMTIGKNSSRPAKDPNSLSAVEDKGLDTELIFDFVARLFHTAEQYQASRAHTQDSASLITECLESMSDDDLQHFIKIGHRRIEGIQKEAYDTDLERSMLQIARAAIHILNNAKHRGAERNERQSIS